MTVSLPTIRPMLAAPSTGTGSRRAVDLTTLVGGWTFDLKLDGLRALLYWNGSTMRLINRNGVDITHKFPDVEAVGPVLGKMPLILDGEVVCDSGQFNDVATRGKQEKPHDIARSMRDKPARFIAFDLLWLNEGDLRGLPYETRRAGLDALLKHAPNMLSTISTDGAAMWSAVTDLGLEGLIAKKNDAPYMEGKRSPAWLKFKTVRRITCIGMGYEPGTGARAHFGAMQLALIGPNGPVAVGDVGTGFTESQILQLKAELDAGQFPLVEIEALNVGANGRLRFPVFRGWRTDLSVADATLAQLDTLPRC